MNGYRVLHRPAGNRFEIIEGSQTAYVEYTLQDNTFNIRHTIVPPALERRGMASALVKAAFDWARENNMKTKATCSYAAEWLRKNPEYQVQKRDN